MFDRSSEIEFVKYPLGFAIAIVVTWSLEIAASMEDPDKYLLAKLLIKPKDLLRCMCKRGRGEKE